MMRNRIFYVGLLVAPAIVLSSYSYAQGGCGRAPEEPEVINGATAQLEQLVENSKTVKGYIEQADTYLDCEVARIKEDTEMSDAQRAKKTEAVKELTARRNAIGDEFNTQVTKFREMNPDNG